MNFFLSDFDSNNNDNDNKPNINAINTNINNNINSKTYSDVDSSQDNFHRIMSNNDDEDENPLQNISKSRSKRFADRNIDEFVMDDQQGGSLDQPYALPLRPIVRGPFEADEQTLDEVSVVYVEPHSTVKLNCEVDLDVQSSVWLKDGQVGNFALKIWKLKFLGRKKNLKKFKKKTAKKCLKKFQKIFGRFFFLQLFLKIKSTKFLPNLNLFQVVQAVDSSERAVSSRFLKEPRGGLSINNVMLEDDGYWQCEAENFRGYMETGRMTKLVVLSPPRPPYLLFESRRLDASNLFIPVKENAEIALSCVSEGGNPKPLLTWEVLLNPSVDHHALKLPPDSLEVQLVKTGKEKERDYKVNSGAKSDAKLPIIYRAHHNARVLCVMEHPSLKIRQNASIVLDVQCE